MELSAQRNALAAVMVLTATAGNSMVAAQLPLSWCTPPLLSLSPCAGFFNTSNSIPPIGPPPGCCSALASLVDTSATCVCQLFSFMLNNPLPLSLPFSFPINQTQALTLPGACGISTPQCKIVGGWANPPAASPDVSGLTTATIPKEASVPISSPSTTVEGPAAFRPQPTSEAGALLNPSFLFVCWGLVLGSMVW